MSNQTTLAGSDAFGSPVFMDWAAPSHAIVAGMTRSGKSALLYTQLSQLANNDTVRVIGIDPSDLLLAPFAQRGETLIILGSQGVDAMIDTLEAIVHVCEHRMATLTQMRADKIDDFTVAQPLLVCVIEEYPGLLEIAASLDAIDKPKGTRASRIKSLVLQLLAQYAKVGLRVVLVAQRADASLIGGIARANIGTRFIMRSDPDGLKMLDPSMTPEEAQLLQRCLPGVCRFICPGQLPLFFHGIDMDYTTYMDTILHHLPGNQS